MAVGSEITRQLTQALDLVSSIPGIRFIIAIGVIVLGYYVSGIVVQVAGRRVARRFRRPSVTRTVLRSVRMGVIVVAIIVAIGVIGVRLEDFVLSAAVFSVILGIILAPIVGSIISGVFVLADQPYEVGDLIELADIERRGFVEDVTLRYTKIFTLDNTFLVLPNSTIRERDVMNYSAEDERTRLALEVLVTYECDIEAARRLMQEAAVATPEVIDGGPDIRIGSARYPARPRCYIKDYAEHGVLLRLRYWVHKPYYLDRIRSKVNERVWARFAEADVKIAYPHSHMIFDESSGQLEVDLNDFDRDSP